MENMNLQLLNEKAEKYDKIKDQRKRSINKYHLTDNGKVARKKASTRYYEKHKEKILAKKKAVYEANKIRLQEKLNEIPKE